MGLAAESTERSTKSPVVEVTLPAAAVLDAFAWASSTVDDLVERTGFGVAEVAVALEELLALGLIRPVGGRFERCAT